MPGGALPHHAGVERAVLQARRLRPRASVPRTVEVELHPDLRGWGFAGARRCRL